MYAIMSMNSEAILLPVAPMQRLTAASMEPVSVAFDRLPTLPPTSLAQRRAESSEGDARAASMLKTCELVIRAGSEDLAHAFFCLVPVVLRYFTPPRMHSVFCW